MSHSQRRICFCTTIASSMSTFIIPIAKRLHDTGDYDITIICGFDDRLKKSMPHYIEYIPVKMKRGLDILFFFRIVQFAKIFKQKKFDIVQYTTPNASFYASSAAKLCKIPSRYYCQWGLRYVGYHGIKRKIFKFIERVTCKNSTHIQSASEQNMHIAISENLCNADKISIVGHGGTIGVDINLFRLEKKEKWRREIREKYNIDSDTFVYGFAGRVNKDKGCNELLEAFREISKKRLKVALLIIGDLDSENSVEPELAAYIYEESKIIITGRVENDVIGKYYAALDVLVHPTYREGFGMVIQEAGAMKVPTITTTIPGASEVMVDKKSALLIEPQNVDELTEAMLFVEKDRNLLGYLGENAYKRTIRYYKRSTMLELQVKKYKELLINSKTTK